MKLSIRRNLNNVLVESILRMECISGRGRVPDYIWPLPAIMESSGILKMIMTYLNLSCQHRDIVGGCSEEPGARGLVRADWGNIAQVQNNYAGN